MPIKSGVVRNSISRYLRWMTPLTEKGSRGKQSERQSRQQSERQSRQQSDRQSERGRRGRQGRRVGRESFGWIKPEGADQRLDPFRIGIEDMEQKIEQLKRIADKWKDAKSSLLLDRKTPRRGQQWRRRGQ